jgi:hypothetical protein
MVKGIGVSDMQKVVSIIKTQHLEKAQNRSSMICIYIAIEPLISNNFSIQVNLNKFLLLFNLIGKAMVGCW